MNKDKVIKLSTVVLFVFSIFFFIASIIAVYFLSVKVDYKIVQAKEIKLLSNNSPYLSANDVEEENIDAQATQGTRFDGKQYVLDFERIENSRDGILYYGWFRKGLDCNIYYNGQMYTGIIFETLSNPRSFTVSLRYTVNGNNYFTALYNTDFAGNVVNDYDGGNFVVAYIEDINDIEAISLFDICFSEKDFEYTINAGTYSMKQHIYAPVVIYSAYSVLPNVEAYYSYTSVNGVSNMFTLNGNIYINNWHVFGSDGVRQAESEVFTLFIEVPCDYYFYEFFNSYYDLAPKITTGDYFINENFLMPEDIFDGLNYEPFARLPFKSNDTQFASMYFGAVIGGGLVYDAMYYNQNPFEAPNLSIIAYNDLTKWSNSNYQHISILADTFVSFTFYEWFTSEFQPYTMLNGAYVWNSTLKSTVTNQLLEFDGNKYLGYFLVYDSDISYSSIELRSIYFSVQEQKMILSGLVDGVERSFTVYDGGKWLQVSFRFVQFVDFRVSQEVFDFIQLNAVKSTDWVVNGNFYQSGYDNGYNVGNQDGYNTGYNKGNSVGYETGYSDGYYKGLETAQDVSFVGMLTSVVEAPFNVIFDMLSFDILGYNMKAFFISLLSLCTLIAVIRWFI